MRGRWEVIGREGIRVAEEGGKVRRRRGEKLGRIEIKVFFGRANRDPPREGRKETRRIYGELRAGGEVW